MATWSAKNVAANGPVEKILAHVASPDAGLEYIRGPTAAFDHDYASSSQSNVASSQSEEQIAGKQNQVISGLESVKEQDRGKGTNVCQSDETSTKLSTKELKNATAFPPDTGCGHERSSFEILFFLIIILLFIGVRRKALRWVISVTSAESEEDEPEE
ncbi:hypothetical protein T4D_7851 [Trichinella pseudospiralis]|uniref:Uncharacterized protein n=1 Tax=Trichinella pseudospiralis TaxID=6337 RepID=A0A0V1FDV4_TRIPS|nr:hypothetical protein T4D_7851 [Trichinella pseudospiralis]